MEIISFIFKENLAKAIKDMKSKQFHVIRTEEAPNDWTADSIGTTDSIFICLIVKCI